MGAQTSRKFNTSEYHKIQRIFKRDKIMDKPIAVSMQFKKSELALLRLAVLRFLDSPIYDIGPIASDRAECMLKKLCDAFEKIGKDNDLDSDR